jgi:hypothetical protein
MAILAIHPSFPEEPMTPSTLLAPARRCAHHCHTVLKSLSPAAIIAATLAVLLGGAGLANAATGGDFILGKANSETATASLANSKGTPLSLSAPNGDAPLTVNQNALVKNLNAQFTGGLSSSQLQATGGDGFTQPGTNTPINDTAPLVAGTGNLPAGVYYVTATADVIVQQADSAAVCFISKGSSALNGLSTGDAGQPGILTLAETVAVRINANDTLQEHCATPGNNGSVAIDAGITAIRIRSSNGTPPARHGHPLSALLNGARPVLPAGR